MVFEEGHKIEGLDIIARGLDVLQLELFELVVDLERSLGLHLRILLHRSSHFLLAIEYLREPLLYRSLKVNLLAIQAPIPLLIVLIVLILGLYLFISQLNRDRLATDPDLLTPPRLPLGLFVCLLFLC